MELSISLPQQSIDAWEKHLDDILQAAAIRGWETAVELTPAAGESKYSTGYMRQSLRVQKTGDMEYTIFSPAAHSVYMEFGTGPRGQRTGGVLEFENDPQPQIQYHTGEVFVTRRGNVLLNQPYVRNTEGMYAQPFLRPALLEAIKVFKELLNNA